MATFIRGVAPFGRFAIAAGQIDEKKITWKNCRDDNVVCGGESVDVFYFVSFFGKHIVSVWRRICAR